MKPGRVLLAASAAVVGMGVTAPAPAVSGRACTDRSDAVISTRGAVGKLSGRYALPRARPKKLVVIAHGYAHSSKDYVPYLIDATRRGALAVAMDYRGLGPAPSHLGWPVQAGAEDSIAAAQSFLRACSTIKQVFIIGISMGGNSSGLAIAAGARKVTDGRPLFDYWVDVEGVTNLLESYVELKAAGLADPDAAVAAEAIEAEAGGTPADVPDAYLQRTVVLRAGDLAEAGLKGAVLVHGLDDGVIPYNQTREMAGALLAVGIPTEVFTVLRRGDGEAGTTGTGHVLGALGLESGLAGHGSDGSRTHLVIRTGFDRLWALMEGALPSGYREFIVDGELGTIPSP